MTRLQNRLIAVFLAATLAPVTVTWWITTSLLEQSLQHAATGELDILSRSLEKTGREFYQRSRQALKAEAATGRIAPVRHPLSERNQWPETVRAFHESSDPERFTLAGPQGDRLDYMVRRNGEVWVYSSGLSGIRMAELSAQYSQARELVEASRGRDLRRGLTYTYVLLAAAVWIVSLGVLVLLARRVSRPIQQLTAGLAELAGGNLEARVEAPARSDEVGQAIRAFNHMAARLNYSRKQLVYLTQLASWQALARKMAHELKNSLTPIRLTLEEVLARHDEKEAAQIVVDELESLERRVRAFSEFADEPPVRPAPLDVNAVVEERIALLKAAHPEVSYSVRAAAGAPAAWADQDLVKGILTNLLENAADAAGSNGRILAATAALDGQVSIEVHDSGPGLSEQARQSLFQPTISFKKGGMGLGLSIARKSALLSGGDILPVEGELGGAAFRVLLPCLPPES